MLQANASCYKATQRLGAQRLAHRSDMDEKFQDLLACPETGRPLTLGVTERYPDGLVKSGILTTEDGSREYPVRDGIPRFCESGDYAESFAFEWGRFGKTQLESANREGSMRDATRQAFLEQTGVTEERLRGKMVVEFGCGPGRFLDVARSLGATVIGLELTSAVDVARENLGGGPGVFLVQGSALSPPFRRDAFDFGFTIGVLHHTPAPCRGAKALVDVVRPGGGVAISVYPEGGFYSFPSVYWTRKFVNQVEAVLGPRWSRSLAMAYAWLSATMFYPIFWLVDKVPWVGGLIAGAWTYFFVVVIVAPDRRWRVLDTFDAITPRYASTHTPEEVEFWLRTFGCEFVRPTGVKFGFSGARPANYTGVKSNPL